MDGRAIIMELAEDLGADYLTGEEAAREGFITDDAGMLHTGTDTPADDYAHVCVTHEDDHFVVGCESSSGDYQPECVWVPDGEASIAVLRSEVESALAAAKAALV